ncbi:MAG: acyl-CoA dehydrogenase family protein, partial [Acidimicrobiales bacterium]
LPRMAAGLDIWAQAWSEPDAGSDLAGIRTSARLEGDHFVVNGQKTWASRAAFADWSFGLYRSDPKAERHQGLTFLLIPLDAPGVTVRPIAQLDGEAGFAEIFFEDVIVGLDSVLGEVNQGWSVAMSAAGFERGVSLRSPARYLATAQRLLDLFNAGGSSTTDAGLRRDVARVWMQAQTYDLYTYWTVTRLMEGDKISSEASLNKILWSELDLDMHALAMELLGSKAELSPTASDVVDGGRWLDGYLFSLAGPIYAGTNQIQRNVIADRVLHLPRAPRN